MEVHREDIMAKVCLYSRISLEKPIVAEFRITSILESLYFVTASALKVKYAALYFIFYKQIEMSLIIVKFACTPGKGGNNP